MVVERSAAADEDDNERWSLFGCISARQSGGTGGNGKCGRYERCNLPPPPPLPPPPCATIGQVRGTTLGHGGDGIAGDVDGDDSVSRGL